MVYPNDILFSLPTLSDPAPAVEVEVLPNGAKSLHEDDWRQVEFVAGTNLALIKQELTSLAAFKQKHHRGEGWTQVDIRNEHPTPFATVRLQFGSLPSFPISALAIGGGPPWGGTVRGGFALTDATDWFIYGQRTDGGQVVQLAVSPGGSAPSEQFALALSQFAQTAELLLVDWYAGLVVETTSAESVLAWTRRFQRQ